MNNSTNQYNLSKIPIPGKSQNEKLAGTKKVNYDLIDFNYDLINFIDDIPPVTNSNIIQMPIRITTPKPIIVRQPSPPRRCVNCKCNISPQQEWMWDMCEICFAKIPDEARRRHF